MSVTQSRTHEVGSDPVGGGAVGPWARRVFWAGILAQCGIVVTGGLVRLTGSGLGCPTWPECTDGSLLPVRDQPEGIHKAIEFGNRTLTFVLLVVLVACIAVAWRHRPRRTPLVVLAVLGVAGIFAQAALGGLTVLTGLNPWIVGAHFMLSMALIAASVALLERGADSGDGPAAARVRPELRALARVIVGWTVLVLTLGVVVTGSGPHSGDAETGRNGLDPRSVSWLHADAVLLLVGLLVALVLALHLTGADRDIRNRAWFLVAAVAAQGFVGYVQYFTGLPEAVVAAHLVGACLVWFAVLRLLFVMRTRDAVAATVTG